MTTFRTSIATIITVVVAVQSTTAFVQKSPLRAPFPPLKAAPQRFADNAEGVVYVNDKCINCAACANFAPDNFRLAGGHHIVYKQPSTESEVDASRAALAACPVAAIRLETTTMKNGDQDKKELAEKMSLRDQAKPFPRLLAPNVWFLGHHNKDSFGAVPYLTRVGGNKWIMIDTPKYSKSSVEAVTGLTGPKGPDYLLLTHVDDTADHNKWRGHFPSLQRIFHSGDLGRHNWLGDKTLEEVEILLENPVVDGDSDGGTLQLFDIDGTPIDSMENNAIIVHTPGHSPGSISLYLPESKTIFTGDTLGYTQRTHTLTGFPRYGNDRRQQAETLRELSKLGWTVVAPGHGHARTYEEDEIPTRRQSELREAMNELKRW